MAFLGAVLALVGCRAPGDGSAPDAASTADPPAGSPLPGEPDAHAFAFDTPRELVTRDGAYVVTWQPTEASIQINDHFEVDVTLARNDERRGPRTGADRGNSKKQSTPRSRQEGGAPKGEGDGVDQPGGRRGGIDGGRRAETVKAARRERAERTAAALLGAASLLGAIGACR